MSNTAAVITVSGAAVWMTSMTLQGDSGTALAIHPSQDAQVHVSGSTILNWNGTEGPVALVERNSSIVFENCTIADNSNTPGWPAVYGRTIKGNTPSTVVVRASSLSGNAAPFFGEWLPRSASFFADAALPVLHIDGNTTSSAQPLSGVGRDGSASVLPAMGNPLLQTVGDGTATDVPTADIGSDVSPGSAGVVAAAAADAPADALSGTVSISTESNNPVTSTTGDTIAADLAAEAADIPAREGDSQSALVSALVVTFAVIASSLVTLILVFVALGEARRRKKKAWLEFDDKDLDGGGPAGEINHQDCQGLPASTQTPGQRAAPELRRDVTLSTHMLVANSTFDPELSPTPQTSRSAARYVEATLAADAPTPADVSDWEGGYGAQCEPGPPAACRNGSTRLPGRTDSGGRASGAAHSILSSESPSDTSSLDFDMRGISTFHEMSCELPR